MSGSKHRKMLSQEVLSVLDSLSPDKASQTDERQAMLLGFEAMCGKLFITNHTGYKSVLHKEDRSLELHLRHRQQALLV